MSNVASMIRGDENDKTELTSVIIAFLEGYLQGHRLARVVRYEESSIGTLGDPDVIVDIESGWVKFWTRGTDVYFEVSGGELYEVRLA